MRRILTITLVITVWGMLLNTTAFSDQNVDAYSGMDLERFPWSIRVYNDQKSNSTISFSPSSSIGDVGWIFGKLPVDSWIKYLLDSNNTTTNKTEQSAFFVLYSKDEKKIKEGYLKDDKFWREVVQKCRESLKDNKWMTKRFTDYPPETMTSSNYHAKAHAEAMKRPPPPPSANDILHEKLLKMRNTWSVDTLTNQLAKAMCAEADGYRPDMALFTMLHLNALAPSKSVPMDQATQLYNVAAELLQKTRDPDNPGYTFQRETLDSWFVSNMFQAHAYELMGGNVMIGIWAQAAVLNHFQSCAEKLKEDPAQKAKAEEIEKFVRESATKLIRDLPQPPIVDYLKALQQNKFPK